MRISVVRDFVDLQLFCDEAGTAATARDEHFVTAAAALYGDLGPREALWIEWLSAHGLAGTKGSRWQYRRGGQIWDELAGFLLTHEIHPIVGRSRSTKDLEEAIRAKSAGREAARSAAGWPKDKGIAGSNMIWVFQMVCTTTLGAAAFAMAEAPVRSLRIWYDELKLGPVATGIARHRVTQTTGEILARQMASQSAPGFDPLDVAVCDRLLLGRLRWRVPSLGPLPGETPWCRMADAIAAWRRAALAGNAEAVAAWSRVTSELTWPGTKSPRLYLDLDVTDGALELAHAPWPTDDCAPPVN